MFFNTKTKKTEDKEVNITRFIPQIKDENIEFKQIEFSPVEETKEEVTYEILRQKIKKLAYEKSENAGHPWGKDKEFWIEAEKELFGENPLQYGGYKVKSGNSYVLICPLANEVPVEVWIDN